MILVKMGGGKKINWDYIAQDLSVLSKKEKLVVVHGASVKRDEIAEKLGWKMRTIISPTGVSSVFTDEKAIEVMLMVYAGLVNKQIVAKLQEYGVNAVGLSGVDGRLWQARWKRNLYIKEGDKVKLVRDSLTGRVEKVNDDLLRLLLENNYVPVLCPPALSWENKIVNTDNDWAAAVVAGTLKIKKIVVLFEAPGFLRDASDETTVITTIGKERLDEFMQYAKGRMRKKVLGAKKAMEMGVEEVYFGDGRVKNPIIKALKGKGTVIS